MIAINAFYIITFAAAFRFIRGDGDLNDDGVKDIPRAAWVAYAAFFCVCVTPNLLHAACWFWAAMVLGIFPTQSLFTAIHGNAPTRRDGRLFAWMQDWSGMMRGGKIRGVWYAVMRSLPALPAFAVMSAASGSVWPLVYYPVYAAHGLPYFLWGLCARASAVKYAEITNAALFAAAACFMY